MMKVKNDTRLAECDEIVEAKQTVITKLAEFTCETRFEDLPPAVMEESKRIILDSIGCALAAATSDKGRGGLAFSRQFGGCPEATVIGFGDKVSAIGATFANAELINALDYDAILPPGHLTPYMLPAYLAVAETTQSSGKRLLLANAIAHEMSHRIGRAMVNQRDIRNGKVVMPAVMGYSCSIFGGTAGVGKIKGFDRNFLANALGLAGQIAPGQSMTAFSKHTPTSTAKYLLAGWTAQGCITAAFLAELGYRGDIQIMNDEFGFWRFMASSKWEPQYITDGLGKEWRFPPLQLYKPYPHCRILHGSIDCLTHIVQSNDIEVEEIESIKAWVEAFCMEPIWANRKIESPLDAQFSVAHALSLVAHRIDPGPEWQDYETIKHPSILALMDKVTYEVHPGYIKALEEDPRSRLSKVEVRARGETFGEERRYPKGTPSPNPETFMTNDELIAKFKHNAQRILPSHKIDTAVEAIMQIEDMQDVSELMKLVTI
ncbi:MmgE/PrpD family protein [Chloroflexota bacterium]